MFLEVRVSVFGGQGELLEGCPGLFLVVTVLW